jgi:hypothetical protein
MALVFYVIATFHAVRMAGVRVLATGGAHRIVLAGALLLLVIAWESRTITTLEVLRYLAGVNQQQWTDLLPGRRQEFASRPVYLRIMEDMVEQGRSPAAPQRTPYPAWASRTLGLP